MWYVWFFDGIGSTIVSLIASAIIGGFTGYKIGIHKKIKLIQKAGNSSEQNQTIELKWFSLIFSLILYSFISNLFLLSDR